MADHKASFSPAKLMRNYGTVAAGILVVIVFTILRPGAFATFGNFINITRQISLLVIISLGATLVMSVSEFDLSIGAFASLGGVIAAKMAVAGFPLPLCFTAPVLICFICGFCNGWIITKYRVLSFITTLGMSTIVSGITFRVTGGSTVFQNIPKAFTYLGARSFLGIPLLTIIMLVFVVVFWFIMSHTAFGRKLYAIGGNQAASMVSGINVALHKNLAFSMSAALAAVCGVLMASRLGSAHPTGGDGFFLQAYAAVYLGSTVSKGGIPNVVGTLVGAAILGILANGLTILQIPTFIQDIITGAIIIFAVVAQKIGGGKSE